MPTDSHSDATDAAEERGQNLRRGLAAPFSLVELDPHLVLAVSAPDSGIMAQEDAVSAGRMRELCPYCGDVPLQLALLSKHVTRPHLYCDKCTRCFDAVYSDGSPVFTFKAIHRTTSQIQAL